MHVVLLLSGPVTCLSGVSATGVCASFIGILPAVQALVPGGPVFASVEALHTLGRSPCILCVLNQPTRAGLSFCLSGGVCAYVGHVMLAGWALGDTIMVMEATN